MALSCAALRLLLSRKKKGKGVVLWVHSWALWSLCCRTPSTAGRRGWRWAQSCWRAGSRWCSRRLSSGLSDRCPGNPEARKWAGRGVNQDIQGDSTYMQIKLRFNVTRWHWLHLKKNIAFHQVQVYLILFQWRTFRNTWPWYLSLNWQALHSSV